MADEKGPGVYEANQVQVFESIVEWFEAVWPRMKAADFLTNATVLCRGGEGNKLVVGWNPDGSVPAANRPAHSYREEYHATMPSRMVAIRQDGILGRLNASDVERQRNYEKANYSESNRREPVVVAYTSPDRSTAAGYPSSAWRGNVKLGEKAARDDTVPFFVVLEVRRTLVDPDSGLSTKRWEISQGNNRQVAVEPHFLEITRAHLYMTDFSTNVEPFVTSLQDKQKWNKSEWERRCRRAAERTERTDIDRVLQQAAVAAGPAIRVDPHQGTGKWADYNKARQAAMTKSERTQRRRERRQRNAPDDPRSNDVAS